MRGSIFGGFGRFEVRYFKVRPNTNCNCKKKYWIIRGKIAREKKQEKLQGKIPGKIARKVTKKLQEN